MLKLRFDKQVPGTKFSEKDFLPLLRRGVNVLSALEQFKKVDWDGSIQLALVDDKTIKNVNRKYRDIDKSTDVLSFSFFGQENFPGEDTVGEIIISLDTAREQAFEHRKTITEELRFLFVHGFLHIFGYDHEKPLERKRMFDLQDKILKDTGWREIIDPKLRHR